MAFLLNKRLLYCCFWMILSFLIFARLALCNTYYVKNLGDDNASGLSDNNAWKTITKVNQFKFKDGDRILFKRGDIFSDAGLRIMRIDNLTIADFGKGVKPFFNGNLKQPISIRDLKNLTIKNINISGQEWVYRKSTNLKIMNVENLTLDGIYGDGHVGIKKNNGKTAIVIKNCFGRIVIKNCELINWGPINLPQKTKDFMGLVLMNIKSGSYDIYDNIINKVNADCIQIYHCEAIGKVYNNILSNAGEDSIDIKGSKNVEVFENQFFRSDSFTGEGGSGSGGIPTYIVVHSPDREKAKNNIIRNNTFLNGDSAAIKIGRAENTRIFENKILKTKSAIIIQDKSVNTLVYNNIIEHPKTRRGYKGMDSGGVYENNSSPGTKIYNNKIYNSKGSCKQLIAIACCDGTQIYNNIVYNINGDENVFSLYYWPCGNRPVINGNTWYGLPNANVVNWEGKIYNITNQHDWQVKHPTDFFVEYISK